MLALVVLLLLCRGCSASSLHGNRHRPFDVGAETENKLVIMHKVRVGAAFGDVNFRDRLVIEPNTAIEHSRRRHRRAVKTATNIQGARKVTIDDSEMYKYLHLCADFVCHFSHSHEVLESRE